MRTPQAHGPGRLIQPPAEPSQRGDYVFVMRKDERDGLLRIGGMNYVCYGCGTLGHLPFRKPGAWPPQQRHDWHWNGDREKPTLTPSINHVGCWHGFLKQGVFVLA